MKTIFDLSRNDWCYKGVLFAEVDFLSATKEIGFPFPSTKGYCAGVMALIWTDETGCWHGKVRIKFPSGNKQVYELSFKKEFDEGVNVNETYVLNYIYKIPMINKTWTKNSDGKSEGIVKILQDLDMIESVTVVKNDERY